MSRVETDEVVALVDEKNRKYLINTSWSERKIKGIGVLDPTILIGKPYGGEISIGNKRFWVFKPSLMDKLQGLKRKAQIIIPKDIGVILVNCSIESGQTILEGGIGSGSLTIALANAVAPTGRVISYDVREDFIEHAMKNLEYSGLKQYVTPKLRDITKGIDENEVDAIILDIPNPWDAILHAWNALKIGGYFCSYSPLISQVEETVKTLKKHRFIEIKTLETLQREIIVTKRGCRPSFDMLGHT
ncbi:MAG TPA: tRNA (adenine-N1)-methyltransferase, partial [Thermoplasmatales archaeon]|nr:tRNA (adenine-N1)-methyltransferase [Thermoplasmatales archaeon]